MHYRGKNYKRIMLLGNSGSGKSWTAERLGKKTGYPVIYLDLECWQAGWKYPPEAEGYEKNREFVNKEEWIIDGNHHETMEMRFQAADLILFFDISRLQCVYSVWKRHGHKRVDLPDYLEEKRDKNFYQLLKWTWDFPKKRRPGLLSIFEKYQDKTILTFRTRKEAEAFLEEVQP